MRSEHEEELVPAFPNGVEVDPLSDILAVLKLESFLSRRVEGFGPWALRFPAYRHMKFGGVLEGRRWLWLQGADEPTVLEEGDFYLITGGSPYCFASDPDARPQDGMKVMAKGLDADGIVRFGKGDIRTVGIGGRFVLDEEASSMLLSSLPPLIHLSGASPHSQPLRAVLEVLRYETATARPGHGAVGANLCSIALVNILRSYIAGEQRPEGWLGALNDPKIGRTMRLLHGDVSRRWTIQELASHVGMSRTSFAERFRKSVGMAPLEYLTQWRMTVARKTLRHDDANLAVIAEKIGYDSETSFSAAFKRMFGQSPGRYRMLHQS